MSKDISRGTLSRDLETLVLVLFEKEKEKVVDLLYRPGQQTRRPDHLGFQAGPV